jgi:aspartyl-tRNA(Asn)/glutamyl-tRNA(Gln) amidotransferase subunit B
MGEFAPPEHLRTKCIGFSVCPCRAAQLAALIGRIADGTISNNAAKQVFEACGH